VVEIQASYSRLSRSSKLRAPPLPGIDEERTAHENEVLRVVRGRMEIAGRMRDLTLDDCIGIAEAVGREMRGSKDGAMPCSMRLH
jgi:hypothetical protein